MKFMRNLGKVGIACLILFAFNNIDIKTSYSFSDSRVCQIQCCDDATGNIVLYNTDDTGGNSNCITAYWDNSSGADQQSCNYSTYLNCSPATCTPSTTYAIKSR